MVRLNEKTLFEQQEDAELKARPVLRPQAYPGGYTSIPAAEWQGGGYTNTWAGSSTNSTATLDLGTTSASISVPMGPEPLLTGAIVKMYDLQPQGSDADKSANLVINNEGWLVTCRDDDNYYSLTHILANVGRKLTEVIENDKD